MVFFPKSSPKHALTLLTLISVFAVAASSQPSKQFIEQCCNTTTYPPLCLKTLSSYAGAAAPTRFTLCDAALDVAIQAAKNCSAAAAASRNRKRLEVREAGMVKDCASELKGAVYELKETVAAMSHLEGGGDSTGEREFQWSNAKTYASAAITDAETCVDGFSEAKGVVSAGVRKKMKGCIDDVEKLISNALSLINHLY